MRDAYRVLLDEILCRSHIMCCLMSVRAGHISLAVRVWAGHISWAIGWPHIVDCWVKFYAGHISWAVE